MPRVERRHQEHAEERRDAEVVPEGGGQLHLLIVNETRHDEAPAGGSRRRSVARFTRCTRLSTVYSRWQPSGLLTYLLIRQRSDEDFANAVSVREVDMETKTKAKAKRRKTTVSKTARRRKTVRKTRIIRKKAAKKAAPRRAARTKAKSTAKVAVKPTPVSQRAQPEAVKPPPSRPVQPTATEQRIGVVTHYYGHLSVVAMQLEPGTTLRLGDVIHIRGHTTGFTQKVESLEVNHAPVTEVAPNDDFGLKVVEHAREHDIVYKVRS